MKRDTRDRASESSIPRQSPEPSKDLEPSGGNGKRHYLARLGTFVLALPGPDNDAEAILAAIGDALEKDTRVAEVVRPKINKKYSQAAMRMYPPSTDDHDAIALGADGFWTIGLTAPIIFRVHVPIKNQPKPHGDEDDIPTDEYWVAWSCTVALVIWRHDPSEPYPRTTGGHVVADILRDVAEACGYGFHVQNCSRGCDNLFLHTTFDICQTPPPENGKRLVKESDLPPGFVRYYSKVTRPPEEVLKRFGSLMYTAGYFSKAKNLELRLSHIEETSRADEWELLRLLSLRATRDLLPVRARLGTRWRMRGWRRRARALITGLWMTLAGAESLQREWDADRRAFLSLAAEHDLSLIFETDFVEEADLLDAMNLGRIERSITQAASRFDNWSLAVATLGGGFAGLFAGLIAALIT